jgi:hypothetical protein
MFINRRTILHPRLLAKAAGDAFLRFRLHAFLNAFLLACLWTLAIGMIVALGKAVGAS